MLTKHDYDTLQAISKLPGGYYPENQRPDFVSVSHQNYLLDIGFLDRRTLVPIHTEPDFPNGESSIQVTAIGFHEMVCFEKEIANDKRQMVQFAITALMALFAVPGLIESVIRLFEFFSKP